MGGIGAGDAWGTGDAWIQQVDDFLRSNGGIEWSDETVREGRSARQFLRQLDDVLSHYGMKAHMYKDGYGEWRVSVLSRTVAWLPLVHWFAELAWFFWPFPKTLYVPRSHAQSQSQRKVMEAIARFADIKNIKVL